MVPAGVTFDPVVSASQASLSAQSQRVMRTEGCGGSQMPSDFCRTQMKKQSLYLHNCRDVLICRAALLVQSAAVFSASPGNAAAASRQML